VWEYDSDVEETDPQIGEPSGNWEWHFGISMIFSCMDRFTDEFS
jgi:hypothetical protein